MKIDILENCQNIYDAKSALIALNKNKELDKTSIQVFDKSSLKEIYSFEIEGRRNRVALLNNICLINVYGSKMNVSIDLEELRMSFVEQEYNILKSIDIDKFLGISKTSFKYELIDVNKSSRVEIETLEDEKVMISEESLFVYNQEERTIKYLDTSNGKVKTKLQLPNFYNLETVVGKYLILARMKGHDIGYKEPDSLLIIDNSTMQILYDLNIQVNQLVAHETSNHVVVKQEGSIVMIDVESGTIVNEFDVDSSTSQLDYRRLRRYESKGIYYDFNGSNDSRIGKIDSESGKTVWEFDLKDDLGEGMTISSWIPLPDGRQLINNKNPKNLITFVLDPME